MPEPDPLELITDGIRGSGLVSPGDRGVVMVSGGADSSCLLTGLAELLGGSSLVALHVNYGLRPEADADQAVASRLCERLGVELKVTRAGEPDGNVQAWARGIRHREAERIRADRELDWIAIGHNRSDLAETFLYRLVSSPGTRSLLAMPGRSGRIIRPLISISAPEIRAAAGRLLPEFAEDATNTDPSFARNRIRKEVMPSLEKINPGAELNIVRTRAEIAEDEELLGQLAEEAARGYEPSLEDSLPVDLIRRSHPAIRRRLLRRLAEGELGAPVAISVDTTAEVTRLAASPEGGEVDFPRGRFVIESSRISALAHHRPGSDAPRPLVIPIGAGDHEFGDWEIRADLIGPDEARSQFGAEGTTFFDADDLAGSDLKVRVWRTGDRIDQLGMDGSRSLQDVFTDGRAPRSRRHNWPVLEAGEEVLWVPGLAVSRHFLVAGHTKRVLRLHAVSTFPI